MSAPVVVSNLAPGLTLTGLVGAELLPADLISRVTARDHRSPYVRIHFTLGYNAAYAALDDATG